MKVIKLHTGGNCFTINPGNGFVFMNFVHSLVALGGFTDGVKLWIPTTAIQAVEYVEEAEKVDEGVPIVMQ
jgi:hypothetical protein